MHIRNDTFIIHCNNINDYLGINLSTIQIVDGHPFGTTEQRKWECERMGGGCQDGRGGCQDGRGGGEMGNVIGC